MPFVWSGQSSHYQALGKPRLTIFPALSVQKIGFEGLDFLDFGLDILLKDFVADLFLEGRDAHVDQPEALVGEQDIVKNQPANVGGAH